MSKYSRRQFMRWLGIQLAGPSIVTTVEKLWKRLVGASDAELHKLAGQICLAIRTGEGIPPDSPVTAEYLAAEYKITPEWARQNPGKCEAQVFSVLKGLQPPAGLDILKPLLIAGGIILGLNLFART